MNVCDLIFRHARWLLDSVSNSYRTPYTFLNLGFLGFIIGIHVDEVFWRVFLTVYVTTTAPHVSFSLMFFQALKYQRIPIWTFFFQPSQFEMEGPCIAACNNVIRPLRIIRRPCRAVCRFVSKYIVSRKNILVKRLIWSTTTFWRKPE